MKKSVVLALIFTLMVLPITALYAKGIQEDYSNSDEKSRVSYAFGVAIGSNLRTTDLELNYNAVAEGLRAVLEGGDALFSEQEALEIIETAIQNVTDKKNEKNKQIEEMFLLANKERPEVRVTKSGLQYEALTETDGKKPASDSIVRVHYEGIFVDGQIFDSSKDESGDANEGATIPLNRVIPGWTEGLMLMGVGSKYKLYIPSELAYGKDGIPPIIPAYSTLIFTVELLEIVTENSGQK